MSIFFYFVLMSVVTFLCFWTDKKRAKSRKYQKRISEKTLLLLCFIGGAFGGIIGMYQLKHKTKKTKFIIGVPIALLLNVAFIIGGWCFDWLK